ncbi:MAG: POTRA domain-containing protein [Bryobacterales bacterium]
MLCLLLAALCLWTDPLPCADFEGLPLGEIRFSPDNDLLLERHRSELILIEPGKPLDNRLLGQTIRNLYATGRFETIDADAELKDGEVTLTFLVRLSHFIGQVSVVGVPNPPTINQLANATKLDAGELMTERRVAAAEQGVLQILLDNGFPDALVKTDTAADDETQQADITLVVEPGVRAGFGRIFVTPSPVLTEPQVREITAWGRGDAYTERSVLRGLERLRKYYQKQDRWQVKVSAIRGGFNADSGEIDVVLNVEPGPRVLVTVEGESFSQGQLRRYIPIFDEGVIDNDLLEEGAENLRNYLQTKGYFNAAVEFDPASASGDEIRVVYDVNRGKRYALVQIEIAGNQWFDLETIRERMLIRTKSFQMRRGRFSQSLLESDISAIEDLYRSNGFRDIAITSRVEEDYQGAQGDLAVSITIREGEPTLVDDLIIEGMQKIKPDRFLPMLASAPGQPFSESSIATDRSLILAEYFNDGYQDASFEWERRPAGEDGRVIVEYHIREGESLYTRGAIVAGLVHTQPHLVQQQIRLTPGEPLSQSDMFETQRRLYDLGIFSRVDVALQNPEGEEPAKNVLLQLEEARRWVVGFGGGAEFARLGGNTGDLSDAVGDATFSPRVTIETTRLNFRGIGHTLNVRTRLSNLQQRALFTYEAPRWTGSEKWKMTLSALYDSSRNVRTFRGTRLEGALQLQHRLSRPSTALYRYTFRRTTIDEATLQISPSLIPLASRPVRVALFSGTYIQDRRDDPTDASRGIYNTADLGFANGYWGSQPDFVRMLGQNATYHRLSPRVVVARSLQIGLMFAAGSRPDSDLPASGLTIRSISNPDVRIPITERFYSGGANSHRGFPVNQAGPRDPLTGFPIGGGATVVNSVELRFPLIGENIRGVLFHDAGNVFSRPGEINFSTSQRSTTSLLPENLPPRARSRAQGTDPITVYDFDYMVHAVGLGVRYRTPIGPIRLDLAYSLNPPRFAGFTGTRDELLVNRGTVSEQRISHFQFHFSLGQTF